MPQIINSEKCEQDYENLNEKEIYRKQESKNEVVCSRKGL